MAERSRNYLKQEFRDGERPTGDDFSDMIDTFLAKTDDGVKINADGNLELTKGITLKDSATGTAGTLRFNGGNVQFHDGVTFKNFTTGGGATFAPVVGGPNIGFNGGNVGIGDFTVTAPTHRFEVNLGQNTGPDQRVRVGNIVFCNGQGALANEAFVSHQSQNANFNDNHALRQGTNGSVSLNAPAAQPITITHGRTQVRLLVVPLTGQVVVGSNTVLAGADLLQVNGAAGKTAGGAAWNVISDARLKQDIRPFADGLPQLMRVRPVRFRYNGQLNTNTEAEEVGILGQEMEQVFPYMISRSKTAAKPEDNIPDELLTYNSNALTYVMVNAIQELAQRVAQLESMLGLQQPNQSEA